MKNVILNYKHTRLECLAATCAQLQLFMTA